jgi:hypothetical protein
MFVSGRQARAILHAAGVSTWHARNALACGLAGQPIRTAGAHLYDETQVRELADRRSVSWREVFETCPEGIFVSRRDLDVALARDEIMDVVSRGWTEISPYVWLWLCLQLDARGRLPFVATVAGFVVLGAEIVGLRPGRGFELAAPGTWFDGFGNTQLAKGPGRAWVLHLDHPSNYCARP